MGEGRVRFVRGGEDGMMKAVSCCISPPPRSIILYPRTHTRPDLSFSLLTQITTSSTPSTTTVTSTRATSTVSRMRTVGFRKFRWHAASQYLSFFLPRERDVTNLTATCRAKTIICQAIAATDLGLTCFTISRNPSSVTWFTTPPSNRRENRKNHHEDTINGRNGR